MSLAAFTFTDRAVPVVELGVGDTRVDVGVAIWDTAHWDNASDATWSGDQPSWLDVTCFVHECQFAYGRARSTDRFGPGGATIVLANDSGLADLDPADQTTVAVRPGRMIRIGVDHVVYGRVWLWCGYVDEVVPRYDPTYHDVVSLDCICALGEVGRVTVPALAAPVGAGELAHVRVLRVLQGAKWPTTKAVVAATGVPMLATSLGGQTADLLGVIADSAGGSVYGDTSGRVVFRGRDWQMWPPDQPNDGNIGNVSADSYCPTEFVVSSRREDIITQIVLARVGDAVPATYTQQKGLELYGPETYTATDLECQQSSMLPVLANRLFRTRGWTTTPRLDMVRFDAATGLDGTHPAIDVMTKSSVFEPSRFTASLALSRGVVYDGEVFVTGIRHNMAPGQWTCEMDMDNASAYVATGGRWDTESYWDTALWN